MQRNLSSSEITKSDRAHVAPVKERHLYGRGSKVNVRYRGNEVFTLLWCTAHFWKALNGAGKIEIISEENIQKILVDGHWIAFDGSPKNWKKSF